MRKVLLCCLLFGLALVCGSTLYAQTGNGAPNGPHYNLNIIGVNNTKDSTMTGSDRHTIFVALGSKSQTATSDIWLTQGPFQVCDGNSFDEAYDCFGNDLGKDGAVFQLPCNSNITDPLADCTGYTAAYEVWARALGKPGGQAKMMVCAIDPLTTDTVCSTENVLLVRGHGKQMFKNVTDELTSLYYGGVRYPLFNSTYEDYFWQYDNNGLKLAQLRFYLISE